MSKKTDKKYITVRYVFETESDDSLRHEPIYELLGDDGYDEFGNFIEINEPKWEGGAPVKLAVVEEAIAKIKELGGTHIEFMYHSDHGSYIMNGSKIGISTEEEVEDYLVAKTVSVRAEKLRMIERLKKEIETLEKTLH